MSPIFPRPTLVRLRGMVMLLSICCSICAGEGIRSRSEIKAIIAHSPDPKFVPYGQELKAAEMVAAQTPNAIAYLGIGASMEPLYPPNTAVVVAPIEYGSIKKGMTVVYLDCDGQRVAHCVVGENRAGYLVRGINNPAADADVVTADNLIGVVVEAYSARSDGRRELTLKDKGKDWQSIPRRGRKS